MEITTNNHPRFTIDAYELTAKEREEFDYLDWEAIDKGEDSAEFVRYKGELVDLSDFSVIPRNASNLELIMDGWHGIKSEGFFFGLLVKFVDDSIEQVVMGRYCT